MANNERMLLTLLLTGGGGYGSMYVLKRKELDMPRMFAMIESMSGDIWNVMVFVAQDESGKIDYNFPVIRIPVRNYEHAKVVVDAYNGG